MALNFASFQRFLLTQKTVIASAVIGALFLVQFWSWFLFLLWLIPHIIVALLGLFHGIGLTLCQGICQLCKYVDLLSVSTFKSTSVLGITWPSNLIGSFQLYLSIRYNAKMQNFIKIGQELQKLSHCDRFREGQGGWGGRNFGTLRKTF